MSDEKPPPTTTDAGIPAASDSHSLSVGPNGPILLQDHYVIQKMAQFNRERVPERVVHAKGSGAHGYFEVTADVSQFTKADFLSEVGKRTPMFARFSTVAGELGSADTARDPRGFALKFYTQEGNYDLVGNNTPVFFVRDPSNFSDFIHSQKRRADTDRRDNNMQWDFWTLKPESAHQVTILMTDRGTPETLRHMNGYGSHTFMWVNAGGERFWIKYHFKTDQGVENFTDAEAGAMAAEDPDFHRKDLWDAIKAGDAPAWTPEGADHAVRGRGGLSLQPVRPHEGLAARRLPARSRSAGWSSTATRRTTSPRSSRPPSSRRTWCPGSARRRTRCCSGGCSATRTRTATGSAPTTCSCRSTRRNARFTATTRTGAMRSKPGSDPVYAPNSYGGPAADEERYRDDATWAVSGDMVRAAYELHAEDDDFGQAGTLVREVLSQDDRDNLVTNILGHAGDPDVQPEMKPRIVEYWSNVDADVGAAVAQGLGVPAPAGVGSR